MNAPTGLHGVDLRKSGWKALGLFAAMLFLVGYTMLRTPQTDRDKGADADGRQYVTMAGDTAMFGPSFARVAPFCYRVATPWMASKLPADGVFAKFRLLALVDVVLMLLLAFALLRALGFSYWDSILGMTLYGGVFWTVKFSFFSPCYIEHSSQMILLLILWVMAKGWWPILPILVFGAFFQKETSVAAVPVFLTYYLQQRGWKWWPFYVLAFFGLAAAIIPYFILRNNVHPINPDLGGPLRAIEDNWKIIITTPGYPRILVVAIFSGLGVLPLLLISHARWVLGYLRQNLHWLVMILFGTFFLLGGQDKARLFLHMLPAITVISVAVLRDLRTRSLTYNFSAFLILVLLLHFFIGNHYSPFRDFVQYLNHLVPEHSPNQGAQGFSRATLLVVLFGIGNFVLRRYPQVANHETQ